MIDPNKYPPWPDTYLHVRRCCDGEEWVEPIKGHMVLDITHRLRAWVKKEFGGFLYLHPPIMPRLEGDYYAQIITDGRPPDSVVVWESGGFYLTSDIGEVRKYSLSKS